MLLLGRRVVELVELGHRLGDVLADDGARVEVAQLEVGELRSQLGAQLVAGLGGEAAQLARDLARLTGEVGELVRPEKNQGQDEYYEDFSGSGHVSADGPGGRRSLYPTV